MHHKSINVAIIDEDTLLRKTLKNYINGQANIRVVIQSADLTDLLYSFRDFNVNVLLMNVYMPKMNGVDAVKVIRSECPDIKILTLSMFADIELLSELLDLGIYGCFLKTDDPDELIDAITCVSEQRIYRNKLFTDVMYWSKQNSIRIQAATPSVSLSEREKEVVRLLWDEKSNKEIADHLFLSVRSVEKIRQDLKDKIGVKSIIGLLKYAIAKKIIGTTTEWQFNAYILENGKHV
jgi:DNA-binding NarL/FixJ family response regulator